MCMLCLSFPFTETIDRDARFCLKLALFDTFSFSRPKRMGMILVLLYLRPQPFRGHTLGTLERQT
jgi:hypothetical protein